MTSIVSHATAVPGPRQANSGRALAAKTGAQSSARQGLAPRGTVDGPETSGALLQKAGGCGASAWHCKDAGWGGKNAGMEQVAAGRAMTGALLARVRAKGSG